jgi:hypothetical protein
MVNSLGRIIHSTYNYELPKEINREKQWIWTLEYPTVEVAVHPDIP